MPLILPNTIANQIPADGEKLDQNFDTIVAWANQEVITRDGQTAMTQPLLLAGPPTTDNQAATKGYVDGNTWIKNVWLNKVDLRGGTVDFAVDFGLAPFTGIAVVTASSFIGFATDQGNAWVGLFTDAYASPAGGGWLIQSPVAVMNVGGTWHGVHNWPMTIPITQGVAPDVRIRYAFSSTNLHTRTVLSIQAGKGTWVAG